MESEKDKRRRQPDFEDELEESANTSRRPKVDPDERDEYEEWRRELGSRGRKRKGKAGDRHRQRRSDDEY